MGPHNPLNFFMTRLLFVENTKTKVNSLKAKSDKEEIVIVVDNARILPNRAAKSFPPIPAPPAAPESPKPVEGRKGARVGGWLNLGGNNNNNSDHKKTPNPPAVYSSEEEEATTPNTLRMSNLKLGDDDDTEVTEESTSQCSEVRAAADQSKRLQLFPTNSARFLIGKKSTSIGRKLGRPSMKRKGSSKSKIGGHGESSPSNSGSEE